MKIRYLILFFLNMLVAQFVYADSTASQIEQKTVILSLQITDNAGFDLKAKKLVQKGSNAFDALKTIVQIKYKDHPEFGAFVTGLCGIDAPQGKSWALYKDGVFSQVGISSITLDNDTEIKWTMKP